MANLDAVSRTLRGMESRQVQQAGKGTISAPGEGQGTIDPDGTYHPPEGSTRWSGRIWVGRPSRGASRTVEVAGGQVLLHMIEVKVPFDAEVEEGDIITLTESRDPKLIGRHLRVREVIVREYGGERLLICEGQQ